MEQVDMFEQPMTIFLEEMEEHVWIINRDLLRLKQAKPDQPDYYAILGSLFRAAHSLRGASRSVDLRAIEGTCLQLEKLFAAVTAGERALGEGVFKLLFETADSLAEANLLLRKKLHPQDHKLRSLARALQAPSSDTERAHEEPRTIRSADKLNNELEDRKTHVLTHVLIVEDSQTQAAWLSQRLEDAGMVTERVGNLADCLQQVKRDIFSAVVLDLTLPDSCGIETLSAVKASAPSLPVIVLTALEDETIGFEALKNGADDFLVKGESHPSALVRAIRYSIERKKQARAVSQTQRQTREIIERAYDAFLAVNLDGIIVDWNRKAQNLFGWSRKEAVGKKLVDLIIDGEGQTLLGEGFETFKTSNRSVVLERLELTGRNRQGDFFPLEMAFFRVQTGDSFSLCSFVTDLTSRKEVEQRMNDFYAVVSHELRAPMTSIRGSLRLLESGIMGDLPLSTVDMVTGSIGSCDRLIRMLTNLLDISKIEAGAMGLNLQDIEPEVLVNEAADGVHGMLSEANIRLKKQVCVKVSVNRMLRADSDKVLQVLTNFLSNAIKFSPPEGEIALSVTPGIADTIRFSVKDQGAGIPESDRLRLFGKFQQLENSLHLKEKGTGLGLAISKAIIDQHNGDIGVESTLGEGTTFWFELPIHEQTP